MILSFFIDSILRFALWNECVCASAFSTALQPIFEVQSNEQQRTTTAVNRKCCCCFYFFRLLACGRGMCVECFCFWFFLVKGLPEYLFIHSFNQINKSLNINLQGFFAAAAAGFVDIDDDDRL